MIVRSNGKPHQIYTRDPNAPFASPGHKGACRTPSGHPEGYLEAFANIYRSAYDAMELRAAGKQFEAKNTVYPNVYDGVDGMNFIIKSVESSKEGGTWLSLKHPALRS